MMRHTYQLVGEVEQANRNKLIPVRFVLGREFATRLVDECVNELRESAGILYPPGWIGWEKRNELLDDYYKARQQDAKDEQAMRAALENGGFLMSVVGVPAEVDLSQEQDFRLETQPRADGRPEGER